MAESEGQVKSSEVDQPKDLAGTAADIFKKVSARYPASVIGQSIAIALECKESGHDPRDLGQALVKDDQRIAELAELANRVHLKKQEIAGSSGPTDVTGDEVRGIAGEDFNTAAGLINFTQNELDGVLALYPQFIKPGFGVREHEYQLEVGRVLNINWESVKTLEDSLGEAIEGLSRSKK